MASGISITTKSESKLCALNNLRKSFAPFVGEEPPFVGEEPPIHILAYLPVLATRRTLTKFCCAKNGEGGI